MGRRRRKIIKKFVPKRFPKLFQCPVCNEQSVTVIHEKDSSYAMVACVNCGTKRSVRWYQSYDDVDAYSDFYDAIMKEKLIAKLPVPVINENLERKLLQKENVRNHLKSKNEIYVTEANSIFHDELNGDRFAKIVSFVNYKGGVGKTTLAVEISAALAYHYSKKVLLIDADPQTNATFYLMDEERWMNLANNNRTIKELFDAALGNRLHDFDLRNIIVTSGLRVHHYTSNLHLIPSHLDLHEIDLELARTFGRGESSLLILHQVLKPISSEYDYIIIDCPPNMYLVTQNAIAASNGIIIVLLPEYLSRVGIALILRIVESINRRLQEHARMFGGTFKGTEVKGIVFNRVRYGASGILRDQEVNINEVRRQYGDLVFTTFVRESIKIAERPEMRIPISISGFRGDERYEEEIRALTNEFIRRFERHES